MNKNQKARPAVHTHNGGTQAHTRNGGTLAHTRDGGTQVHTRDDGTQATDTEFKFRAWKQWNLD